MNDLLIKIEKELGFELPREIVDLYSSIEKYKNKYFIFDTRNLGEHWLLKSNYTLIQPKEKNKKWKKDFFIKDFYVNEDDNIIMAINEKVSRSVKQHWSENKIFAFAWSNEVVEKDASLIYVFNNDGSVKGIFIHSLNFATEKVYVAKNLKDVFKLELKDLINSELFKFELRSNIGHEERSFVKIVKGSYKIIDLESVDDVYDYKGIIEIFTKLSNRKFFPIIKSLKEENDIRIIEIEINGKFYSTNLKGGTDWLDLTIVDFINNCLFDNGFTRKKFIVFRSVNFGQEIAVSFVSNPTLKVLQGNKDIEILA